MKTDTALWTIFALVLTLTGCGGGGSSEAQMFPDSGEDESDESGGSDEPDLLPDFKVVSVSTSGFEDCMDHEATPFQIGVTIENIGEGVATSPDTIWLYESLSEDFSLGGTVTRDKISTKSLKPGESFLATTDNTWHAVTCDTGYLGHYDSTDKADFDAGKRLSVYAKVMINPDDGDNLTPAFGVSGVLTPSKAINELDRTNNLSNEFEIEKMVRWDCLEDNLEENDSLESATPLLLNQQYELSFCTDSIDVVSFQLEKGAVYLIENTNDSVNYDLYQPDDVRQLDGYHSESVLYQAQQSGLHRIVFYPRRNSPSETTIRLTEQEQSAEGELKWNHYLLSND